MGAADTFPRGSTTWDLREVLLLLVVHGFPSLSSHVLFSSKLFQRKLRGLLLSCNDLLETVADFFWLSDLPPRVTFSWLALLAHGSLFLLFLAP
jgi:hypothetical protein